MLSKILMFVHSSRLGGPGQSELAATVGQYFKGRQAQNVASCGFQQCDPKSLPIFLKSARHFRIGPEKRSYRNVGTGQKPHSGKPTSRDLAGAIPSVVSRMAGCGKGK
jgi:hypothetical protein